MLAQTLRAAWLSPDNFCGISIGTRGGWKLIPDFPRSPRGAFGAGRAGFTGRAGDISRDPG
jgi:hypothetical protein